MVAPTLEALEVAAAVGGDTSTGFAERLPAPLLMPQMHLVAMEEMPVMVGQGRASVGQAAQAGPEGTSTSAIYRPAPGIPLEA